VASTFSRYGATASRACEPYGAAVSSRVKSSRVESSQVKTWWRTVPAWRTARPCRLRR
jgi:hypothetical protein